jgi:type IV secretory pathway TrbD component
MVRGTVKGSNQGLSKPVNMGGVEKYYMILNGTVAFIIVFAGFPHLIAAVSVPQFIIFHFIGRAIYKSDPYFFAVFKRYRRYDSDRTSYLPAQSSVYSKGFIFVPRSVSVKGMKSITVEE